jgi:hypothetical protein
VAEEELCQPEIVVGALELGRGRVAPPVHMHPARSPFGDESRTGEAAIPPEVGELPRRLSVVVPARHDRVADVLVADRDDLLGILDVDAHPSRIASVQEPMVRRC